MKRFKTFDLGIVSEHTDLEPTPMLQPQDPEELSQPAALRLISDAQRRHPLTRREMQMFEAISGGATNKEIATLYGLTEGTVKIYVSRLFRKLGVQNRLEVCALGHDTKADLRILEFAIEMFAASPRPSYTREEVIDVLKRIRHMRTDPTNYVWQTVVAMQARKYTMPERDSA